MFICYFAMLLCCVVFSSVISPGFLALKGGKTPNGSDQNRFCGVLPKTFVLSPGFFGIEGGTRLLKGVIKNRVCGV